MTVPPDDASLFIGLMSGTSLDGVDAVLADCAVTPPVTLAHRYRSFSSELRGALGGLCASGPDEIERSSAAARDVAHIYAACVDDLLHASGVSRGSVRAIGAHGQTVRHRPQLGYSVQLNAPAWLAELTQIDVVADFRSRDIAAGGHGAPLASIFHLAAFGTSRPRAVINLGGISNLTGLPASTALTGEPVVGFDCGPGNLLLDFWTQRYFGAPFDCDGAIAASAEPDQRLLEALLAEPFFDLPPPKSTGRELFSPHWLDRAMSRGNEQELPTLSPEVVLATLTRLTAVAIGDAIERWFPQAADVVLCGGGTRNATLQRMLAAQCAPRQVLASSDVGVAPDQVEALAFAWLAHAHMRGLHGNVPSVTGARGGRILGALYPAGHL
ncbi:MAG: anhydro-N-acetylmuramic acid kinase [Burkholderiaceae bacterium]|nr:anhydro-N-acetylmuramic acid kinase [Burkholderiaceae bacterium]